MGMTVLRNKNLHHHLLFNWVRAQEESMRGAMATTRPVRMNTKIPAYALGIWFNRQVGDRF
jgi:hypothetical protein